MTDRDILTALGIFACVLAATAVTWWLAERATNTSSSAEGELKMRHTRMLWTREEEEELRALILSGKSEEAIAKKLNRTLRAIQTRANKLKLPLKKVIRRGEEWLKSAS
jgi:DNA-binding NarL/FixJ family response regulator